MQIKNIIPYHNQKFPKLAKNQKEYIKPEAVTASSEYLIAANVLDDNFGTRWEAAANDTAAFLTVSFKDKTYIDTMEIRFEYPWKNYYVKTDVSVTGNDWTMVADYTINGISGSPVLIPVKKESKYIRISFEHKEKPSIWDLYFLK